MLNLTKRVDYALIALTHLAVHGSADGPSRLSVRGVAETYGMSQPLLANVMKDLARAGFVHSARGTKGGYELAVPPEALAVGRVVEALEGPLQLTQCVSESEPTNGSMQGEESCSLFNKCLIRRSVFVIHMKIRDALYGITVADLAKQAGQGHASERLVAIAPAPPASGDQINEVAGET